MAHQFPELAAKGVGGRFRDALQLVVQAHVEELQQLRADTGELRTETKNARVEGKKSMRTVSRSSSGKPVSAPRYYQSKDPTHILPALCQSQDDCLIDLTVIPHSPRDVASRAPRMGIADSPRPDTIGDVDGALLDLQVNGVAAHTCSDGPPVQKLKTRLEDIWLIDEFEDPDMVMGGRLSLNHYEKSLVVDMESNGSPLGNWLVRMVEHSHFEMVFCILILLSTITIALEAQYEGLDMGHKIGFVGHDLSAADKYPRVSEILNAADIFFGICFTVELLLKILALGLRFFLQSWNVFDLFTVAIWGIGNLNDFDEVGNPMMLRVFRLLKITRIVRLFKTSSSVDSLLVLVKSLQASLCALLWSSCFIILMLTFTSLGVSIFMSPYFMDEAEPIERRREAFEYFGTFTRNALSLFEATLGNFAPVMRKACNVNDNWSIFFMVYKMIGGFAVIAVINGVFLQETFKVANSDDDLMLLKQRRKVVRHMQKMGRLLQETGDKAIDDHGFSWKTFNALFNDPFVKSWLAAYEFDFYDVKVVFELMQDGGGHITVDELMAGVSRLKGGARSIDLHVMLYQVNELKKLLGNLQKDVQNLRHFKNGN